MNRGELVSNSTWIDGQNHPILAETTHYVFARQGATRSIDLMVTLTALDHVVFNDDKDGLLGLRVARWLESPEEKGGTFTDANGVATNGCSRGKCSWRCAADGRISDQRRRERRSCVVNARPLVLADWTRWRRTRCDDCDFRPSGKHWLPDLLARARLRTFCRQSAGQTRVRCEASAAELHARKGPIGDVPLSHRVLYLCCDRGGVERRGGCFCGGARNALAIGHQLPASSSKLPAKCNEWRSAMERGGRPSSFL